MIFVPLSRWKSFRPWAWSTLILLQKKTCSPTTPQATQTVCTKNSSKPSRGTIDRSGLGTQNKPIGLQTPEIEIASTPYFSQDRSYDDDKSDSTSHESSISDTLKVRLVVKGNKAPMRSHCSPMSDSNSVTDLSKDEIGNVCESQKNFLRERFDEDSNYYSS
jgi:hypothetical protein